LNGLQDRAEFRQGSWELANGRYAVIAANIYLGPLVNMIHALRRLLQPHGVMILSGILTFQEMALRTALRTAHLAVVEQLVEDNWVALAVQHQEALSGPPR
jgi:ribosomal protein L11 methyltransferase